jgi:hypothetical protein
VQDQFPLALPQGRTTHFARIPLMW